MAPNTTGSARKALSRHLGHFLGIAWRSTLSLLSLLLLGVTLLPFESIAHRSMAPLVPEVGGLREATLQLHRAMQYRSAKNFLRAY